MRSFLVWKWKPFDKVTKSGNLFKKKIFTIFSLYQVYWGTIGRNSQNHIVKSDLRKLWWSHQRSKSHVCIEILYYLINKRHEGGIWNSLHHGQTIHPIENFIARILFKIPFIVTWSQLFLTSEVMEAVRGQKPSSEGQKRTKEWIFWKKFLIKVVQWPQKTP